MPSKAVASLYNIIGFPRFIVRAKRNKANHRNGCSNYRNTKKNYRNAKKNYRNDSFAYHGIPHTATRASANPAFCVTHFAFPSFA